MPAKTNLPDRLVRLLVPLGPVEARRMFGAHGLFLDGVMFAILVGDALFLKVDDRNRPDFESAGMSPFRPWGDSRALTSYYEAPPEIMRDGRPLRAWAKKAIAAARASRARRRAKAR
ncbi:MAG: TfoX/Sxy family protein [Alphaproteobacteria bacterium]